MFMRSILSVQQSNVTDFLHKGLTFVLEENQKKDGMRG